jgi:L-fuconolactonase
MFGGDWPICELAKYELKWQQWLEILSEIVKDWTEEEKDKLFVINATRFYKLNHTK